MAAQRPVEPLARVRIPLATPQNTFQPEGILFLKNCPKYRLVKFYFSEYNNIRLSIEK